jgi:hypothetical protein
VCETYQTTECCSWVCGILVHPLVNFMFSSAGSFLPAEILTCPQCQALHMPHVGPKLVILFCLVHLTTNSSFKSCNHNWRIPIAVLSGMIYIQTASSLSLSPKTEMMPSLQSPQCTAITRKCQYKKCKNLKRSLTQFFSSTLNYITTSSSSSLTVSGTRSAPTSKSIVTEVAHNWY